MPPPTPTPTPTPVPIPTPAPAVSVSSHSDPAAPSNRHPFTHDQYAIALAFAKSLPAGRSTEGEPSILVHIRSSQSNFSEHLGELQNHIKCGSNVPPSKRLEFDAFEYWRDECQKLRQEKRALEDKLLQVESRSRRNKRSSDHDKGSSQESEEDRQDGMRGSSRKRGFLDDNLRHLSLNMNDVYLDLQTDDPVHRLNGHG